MTDPHGVSEMRRRGSAAVANGTPTQSSDPVRAIFVEWRDSLINLTGRNRLLNFKPLKTSAVAFVRPKPQVVLTRLIGKGVFRFRSLAPAEEAEDDPRGTSPGLPPAPDPSMLDTEVEEKVLKAALHRLARRGTAEYLDRGLSVLYLAFGSLHWVDVDGEGFTSPLLMVPIRLVAPARGQPPMLQIGDEDLVVNPALALKLKEFEVELPVVDDPEDIDLPELLDAVSSLVEGKRGWEVRDDLVLSYFSFHKEAMYRDLLEHEELILGHPAVQALANGGTDRETSDFLFDEIPDERIDDEAPPERQPLVLDADSSQRACVAAAVAGRSFVMDGPPGTGKSQTIANMIAALMHAGRRVLFVSEKAAALDVVRNRLADVGLGSYVLELHSHKATRRDVALALGMALDAQPVPPQGMSNLDRTTAQRHRESLNAYAAAINEVRQPFGFSLNRVLGWIACMQDVPLAPAPLKAPADLTVETLTEIRQAEQDLARAWRPAEEGSTFVWREVVERNSMEALLYQAGNALETLRSLAERNGELTAAFELHAPSQTQALTGLLDLAGRRPAGTPSEWLVAESLAPPTDALERLGRSIDRLRTAEAAVTDETGHPWRAIPDLPPLDLEPEQLRTLRPETAGLADLSIEEAGSTAAQFGQDARMLFRRHTDLNDLAVLFGLPPVASFDDADRTLAVASIAFEPLRPVRGWLSSEGLASAVYAVTRLRADLSDESRTEASAAVWFTEAAPGADLHGLQHRFERTQMGFGRLRSEYRTDKRTLAGLIVPGVKPKDAAKHLAEAVAWKDARSALSAAEAAHADVLDSYYQRHSTDFSAIAVALEHARTAITAAGATSLRRLAEQIAVGTHPNPSVRTTVEKVRGDLTEWRHRLGPRPLRAPATLTTLPMLSASEWLSAHVGPLRASADAAQAITSAVGRPTTVGRAAHILTLRAAALEAHRALQERQNDDRMRLGDLYDGPETPLSEIAMALDWARRARQATSGADRPLTIGQAQALGDAVPNPRLADALTTWTSARDSVLRSFSAQRRPGIAAALDHWEDTAEFITDLREDSGGREEWFSYANARSRLRDSGLDSTVEFCIDQRVHGSDVPRVLDRALLHGWADHIFASDPALAITRSADRDALIREYRELDRRLVTTAVSEIIAAVNTRRPRNDLGQSSIIRNEAAKKRRHMPVRDLVRRTRDVTQSIKPCFMMSPLSVSQFLPGDMSFDVVIFDEASQVRPADAINCIYRGNALIVAGDQKQLPPTSFFDAGVTDTDDEWDPDVSNAKDFDSILDLAKGSGSMKSLTLRWHYRSRHEGLIAFSNASFYRGQLITFPGSEDAGNDVGVDLIHVPGTYRRGTSRDNLIEAERVASAILHHFDTRPTRSLGVVTFSEAQAAAIENALEVARSSRTDLDRFFGEDRLAGFFVKNLEAVQGDERDVMIFSVGYGPDEAGKITMNFGPLNKPGGWRRLNVAITRARYRNEIFTSIRAGDITDGTNESLRHFKRFLDYAARGVAALALDGSTGGDAESPFEEAVIQTIRSWGYDAEPQVGASGYRIDIGIRHPSQPGVFALGVECDGYMYHSSRSARDRDRLREQVLVGLGWRLHRIWGTAWYRDRSGEERRLRDAIDQALAAPVLGLLATPDTHQDARPPVTTSEVVLPDRPEWAVPYAATRVAPLPRWIDLSEPGAYYEMTPYIAQIAEAEGPIHIDVLNERLRDAWRIGRVGSRISKNIDAAIRKARLKRAGDFVDITDRTHYTVRTPTAQVSRNINEVHDSELRVALTNCAHDSRGIAQDDLTIAVSRLYGWNRRGPDITARLNQLIEQLLYDGGLVGDTTRLTTAEGFAPRAAEDL